MAKLLPNGDHRRQTAFSSDDFERLDMDRTTHIQAMRTQRMKDIYKRVLYKAGDPHAKSLFDRYFRPRGIGDFDVDAYETEIKDEELRLKLAKATVMVTKLGQVAKRSVQSSHHSSPTGRKPQDRRYHGLSYGRLFVPPSTGLKPLPLARPIRTTTSLMNSLN